jgi:hypothetical protein
MFTLIYSATKLGCFSSNNKTKKKIEKEAKDVMPLFLIALERKTIIM